MSTIENATVSQLADAIRAAAEETTWVPDDGPARDEYYRRVALRTQGHLRKCGVIGMISLPDRSRMLDAIARVKAGTPAGVGGA